MGAKRNIPLAGDASRRMAEAEYQAAKKDTSRRMAEAEYQAAKQREYDKRFGARF